MAIFTCPACRVANEVPTPMVGHVVLCVCCRQPFTPTPTRPVAQPIARRPRIRRAPLWHLVVWLGVPTAIIGALAVASRFQQADTTRPADDRGNVAPQLAVVAVDQQPPIRPVVEAPPNFAPKWVPSNLVRAKNDSGDFAFIYTYRTDIQRVDELLKAKDAFGISELVGQNRLLYLRNECQLRVIKVADVGRTEDSTLYEVRIIDRWPAYPRDDVRDAELRGKSGYIWGLMLVEEPK